jgi:hypothetical protein
MEMRLYSLIFIDHKKKQIMQEKKFGKVETLGISTDLFRKVKNKYEKTINSVKPNR